MEQVNSNPTLAMLQAAVAQTQLPKAGKNGMDGEFQKLMGKTASSSKAPARDTDRPKAPTADKAQQTPAKENEDDDPKALSAGLVPVPQEVLAQYPPEWLPLNLQEGEPVVCVGMRTGVNGEGIPILMGASEAAEKLGQHLLGHGDQPSAQRLGVVVLVLLGGGLLGLVGRRGLGPVGVPRRGLAAGSGLAHQLLELTVHAVLPGLGELGLGNGGLKHG